ncbi:MAG: ABC transporter permease [Balneolales bacterium]|nr:ABC transporter permease [Balneolales bacterium]
MLKNYLKIGYRNLKRSKAYTSINVFGLTIGLSAFIVIGLFVQYELSFDRFHDYSKDIHRVIKTDLNTSFFGTDKYASTPGPLDELLMTNYAEVEYATQLAKARSFLEVDNEVYNEQGIFAANHFFDVFTFPFLQGDPSTALENPNSLVITEELAFKYFGRVDVVGETIFVAHEGSFFSGKNLMEITGVLIETPENSHLSFDYIVSVHSSEELVHYLDNWNSNHYLTYVRLKPGYSPESFSEKIADLEQKYIGDSNPFKESGLALQPLESIHLHSNIPGEFKTNGNIFSVYLFSTLAIIILSIACINYTNLATARSFLRAREVGVRKAVGANKSQLVVQFLSESILLTILALTIAFAVVQFLLPVFNTISARELSLSFFENPWFILSVGTLGILLGIIAGSYPAFKISGYQPSKVLKGAEGAANRGSSFRNILVVSQFAATTCLIIATITVFDQLNFMRSANTGLDHTLVLSIPVKDQNLHTKYSSLKSQLERNSTIELVSAAQNDPIAIDSSSPLTEWENSEENAWINVYRSAIQHDYIELFDMEIVEGRDFSMEISTDLTRGMIINETLKNQLGWENAVGKEFKFRGRDARITGVVKDFNFRSFHEGIEPLALFLEQDWWFPYQRVFVKMNSANPRETIAYIENVFRDFSPDYPFEYQFLDETYNNLYHSEIQLGTLFNYFTFVALFISCLGILGLAAFTVSQRKREIGIRKVLGASVQNIVSLLSLQYLKPVLLGFTIAAPVAWYGLTLWLQNFAYRIDLGAFPFLAAGLSTLFIALFTVSGQCIKAALTNPIESLKTE